MVLVITSCPGLASGKHNKGVNQIDWSSEPPAPPVDFSFEDEYSPAHRREDNMLSFHSRPPVALPEGTILLHNGTLRFPNGTLLLTEYLDDVLRPALLPSGEIILRNGTKTNPSSPEPLTAQRDEDGMYDLLLPRGARVYRNGSVAFGKHVIMTVFQNGFIPDCDGVSCHHNPLKVALQVKG